MHECQAGDTIVNGRTGGIGCSDHEIASPNEDKVGMVNVETQPFTGDYTQRSERLFTKPRLDFFSSEHDDFSGVEPNAMYFKEGHKRCQGKPVEDGAR